jgi:DNA-binding transcriptional LysR family regulator
MPIAISNNSTWLGEQTVAGQGIMMAPRWSVQDLLDSGELQELPIEPALRISQNPDLAIYLLYQKQQYLVPKVKVAVDFLVSRFSVD